MADVLYISYDGLTDPLGQSQVLPYIIGLNRKGFSFVLLTCEKRENYIRNKDTINKIIEGLEIRWEPNFYTKNPPIFSTVYDYWKLKLKAHFLYKTEKFKLVHCRSYIPSMIGLRMQEKYNVKFLFDMRGFWADERVDGGLWDLNKIIYRQVYKFFKSKEKAFLENADHIVSLTHAGKNEIKMWKNIIKDNLPISIIPCCVDTDLFNNDRVSESKLTEARQSLGIMSGESVITYLGSIGTWYLLDEMLAFFKVYLTKKPNSKFLFITPDSAEFIVTSASKMGIRSGSIITVSSDRADVPVYASVGEFSLFFIKPAYSKKSSSPTKQGELMALGIPIICNANVGDTDMIVNDYKSGLIVNNFNDYEYDKTISELDLIKFESKKLRSGAIDYFSLEKGIASYNEIYKSLIN